MCACERRVCVCVCIRYALESIEFLPHLRCSSIRHLSGANADGDAIFAVEFDQLTVLGASNDCNDIGDPRESSQFGAGNV